MITITVTPAMAEQIREFCIAHKAIHMSAIDRHSAAVIELDNLATSLIEDEHDALEAELIGSMIASSFEQIEARRRAQEMQIGGPTSEHKPTGATPINFFNDAGELYTVPDQGGILPNNIPTPSSFADAKIWAAWLVERYTIDGLTPNTPPVSPWKSLRTVKDLVKDLVQCIDRGDFHPFHSHKDVRASWQSSYDFGVALKAFDAEHGCNLLSSWMIDLILVQNQRENAGAMD